MSNESESSTDGQQMKTYQMVIVMDAINEEDFIEAVLLLNAGEFREHVSLVED